MQTTARSNLKQRSLWLTIALLSAGLLILSARAETAPAQNTPLTSRPLRLAIVPEEPSVAPAADLLTVELSQKDRLQLLERAELDKAYREQALSAANKDYLKLGQILGADGLLLLSRLKEGTNEFLQASLVAVKPGVIIRGVRFPWPLADGAQWAKWLANHLAPFLPKLGVLARDAVPISVVNLRSAVRAPETQELEHQLTLLIIERLSRQREFFVLERRRMDLLTAEKDLQGLDESAFWNGSYLLDGIIDRDGYSKEIVTLSVRLVPPGGGPPQPIEVSGSRTNLSDPLNRLVTKVAEGLNLHSYDITWNPADEAAQYFEAAKWALRWGLIQEAQVASESAWALGKRDWDSASVRVRACVQGVGLGLPGFQSGQSTFATHSGYTVERALRKVSASRPLALVVQQREQGTSTVLNYIAADTLPESSAIDRAARALQLYSAFNHTLPPDEPKANSPWYDLGIDALDAASTVLQYFHFVPESQKGVEGKLAQLRWLARSAAAGLAKAPSVHHTFWVGARETTHEESTDRLQKGRNIFKCLVKYGYLWQDRPEEALALYRELMTSLAFSYIHEGWLTRELQNPRLAAWNAEDRKRLPNLWDNFVGELNASTNPLCRIEAKFLELAEAKSDTNMALALDGLCATILANHDVLVTNTVESIFGQAETSLFILKTVGGGKLEKQFFSDYRPRLAALAKDWEDNRALRQNQASFEEQKQYLATNAPYAFFEFAQTFRFSQYSKTQAAELQPLLSAYKSNLVTQAVGKSGFAKTQAQGAITHVASVEAIVSRILNPASAPLAKRQTAINLNSTSPTPVPAPTAPRTPPPALQAPSNVLLVKNYLRIPQAQLHDTNISRFAVNAHRWSEGRLLLALWYEGSFQQGPFQLFSSVSQAAVGILNPKNETWELIKYPRASVRDYSVNTHPQGFARGGRERGPNFQLFQGDFYLSDGGLVKRFDFKSRQWAVLSLPQGRDSQLFTVNGFLLAANEEAILEITAAGQITRILASTRRRPPVSALDSLDNLGSPTLFAGPNRSLRARIGNNIFTWTTNNWREEFTLPLSQAPEVFDDLVIFRSVSSSAPARFWVLLNNRSAPELCLLDKPKPLPNMSPGRLPRPDAPSPQPLWQSLKGDYLVDSPAASFNSNVWFLVDHSLVTNTAAGQWTVAELDGFHAKLVCLDRDLSEPIVVPLSVDLSRGPRPISTIPSQAFWMTVPPWGLFAGGFLFIGHPNTPGVWALPIADIEPAIAREKRAMMEKISREKVLAERRIQTILTKYDGNHNGVIDPQEKLRALDDPEFPKYELDRIRANRRP